MKYNNFAKKLLKMEMGSSVTLKKKTGEVEGVFIRIPSGWVYRYMSRHGTTSCFIPYTDDLQFYDDDMHLKPCKNCTSTQVYLGHDVDKNVHFVRCEKCHAHSGANDTAKDAISSWNMKN